MFPVWNNLIFLLSMRTLLDLKQGESGIIIKVKGRGAFRKRIMEMGFIVGKDVKVVRKAPLKDPVEYEIMGYNVSLRNSEAALIEVMGHHEQSHLFLSDYDGIIEDDAFRQQAVRKDKIINVALVGNPNSGKTTLFNLASGSRERVGNYSGVTVDAKTAHFRFGDYLINVVDLPGTYSITSYTPEELYVRNYIIEEVPDIVINIVDAGNLERNIYLTTQLIDMDIRVVVALNMFDELQKKRRSL
jgi:ferrous iron transport protein B